VDQATTISLTGISLDGGRPEGALRPLKNKKMYFLLPFDLKLMMAGGGGHYLLWTHWGEGELFLHKVEQSLLRPWTQTCKNVQGDGLGGWVLHQ
jgi:hypothetical protein